MKEHRKNITSSDVLEMMVQAGLKPASELERLRVERDDSEDEEEGKGSKKNRVA
jgi:hypothetical protein